MKFRYLNESNRKRKKNSMGYFYSMDAGDVPQAMDRFNNSVSDGATGLSEAYTRPLSDFSSFTGWDDDDNLVDAEERFYAKIEKYFKESRDDIQVLEDSDNLPSNYDYMDSDIVKTGKVIKTKYLQAEEYTFNNIKFLVEVDASSYSNNGVMYFKSEEDADAYVNYVDSLFNDYGYDEYSDRISNYYDPGE